MKQTLEKLWDEYLLDECALFNTDKERNLTKKCSELHRKAIELLNKEQEKAMEEYVDSLSDIETLFAKKAFCKGCEFALSFVLEALNSEK